MQRLEFISNRIRDAEDLQMVVHTMKIYSAAKIRQYERGVISLSEYFRTIELGFRILYREFPFQIPSKSKEKYPIGVIIFGSGQPFCGSFDEQLAGFVNESLQREGSAPSALITVGDRIGESLRFYNLESDQTFEVPGTINGLNDTILKLLDEIDHWEEVRHIRKVLLFHNKPLNQIGFSPNRQRLLPLDRIWLRDMARQPWPSNNLPMSPPPVELMAESLIKQYLFVSLYRGGVESLAAEYGSRLSAMQSAEEKIKDHLAFLQGEFRRVRQTAIDEELLDIRSGFEAVMGNSG